MLETTTELVAEWGVPALIALGSIAVVVILLVVVVRIARRGKRARIQHVRPIRRPGLEMRVFSPLAARGAFGVAGVSQVH